MPLIEKSTYQPPFIFRNNHLNTIYPSLFRKVKGVEYNRERIETPDDDFIDLDWSTVGSKKLVIVLHGLEGSADRAYVRGVVKRLNDQGWDGLGFNFRGCSGEDNRQARSYHSGETEDLDLIIQKVKKMDVYKQVAIVGFSLGGNVVLKYVGERGANLDSLITHAIGISVPCHLESGSAQLSQWYNKIYMNRFLVTLKEKAEDKRSLIEHLVDFEKIHGSKDFYGFDHHLTAPINGFESAIDYWTKSSSKQFLPNIKIPTLMINAIDDSFLGEESYPRALAKDHPFFFLETPKYGGHVGFAGTDSKGYYWTDNRVVEFLLGNVN